ncbi:hemicentin-1-like [Mercenaria mercenaria]|uniref:hemicentin-1-like n=1 Tax=Mercenaria mercenaria TaxID=6596 RepID=UPI00234F1574|nr:hemicentin-1-like [Mercenaria mercenaria]
MGDIKHAKKLSSTTDELRVVDGSSSSGTLCCLRATIWTLSLFTVVGAFVLMNYLQYDQILRLKQRVEYLENSALLFDEPISVSHKEKRDSDGPFAILTNIVDDLVRQEVKRAHELCKCPGDVREAKQGCGESLSKRQLVSGQQCCTALAKPSYRGNSTEIVTSYLGQEVLLPCNATGYPPPTVSFTPSVDPTGKSRYRPTPGGMLIQNVQFSDGGRYYCKVENALGVQNKIIELRVTDPVVATTTPTSVTVNEGSSIRIQCDVTGNPTPVVTWQHQRLDGVTVPVIATPQTIITGNTITINNALASNAGSYICLAQNQFEKDQASTTVNVIGKPQIVQPPKTQTVLQGSTVRLYCSVASNPPATITWTYPLTGSKPPLNAYVNPDNSVTLSNVDKYNNGNYQCAASNSYGTSYAQSSLVVEKKVSVATTPHLQPMTGSEPILNFQCSVDGIPKPTTTWSKVGAAPLAGNSKYLALSGGNLIISGPSLATDTGIFECFGTNRNGNATDSVIVYRALGQIKCTDTFASVGCTMGQTCGGHCPNNCNFQGQNVYGYKTYAMDSAICMAATHSGSLPNPNNDPVIWKHVASGIFSGVSNNGITSQSHASSDASQIIQPSTGRSSAGNSLIG